MLTEEEVRELSARRDRVILPVMAAAIGMVFLYFVGLGAYRGTLIDLAASRFGEAARDVAPTVSVLPAFAIFLLPSCLAAKYAGRYRTWCPACRADVSSRTHRLLSTRCCPSCGRRILDGGRSHSAAVYKRYQELRSRRLLKLWLWAWPVLGGFVMAYHLVDRPAFQNCPQCLWLGPLVGTAAAGWAWIRTFDRCYVPQLVASVVLLPLGGLLFWQSL